MVILTAIEQELLPKQRHEIESRLANYNIPLQIFQIVAEKCECTIDVHAKKEIPKGPKILSLLAGLNDKSILLLKQAFLDCEDSFSNFRFAVFLSSRYSPMSHKFVMDCKLDGGKSKPGHAVDICIYSRHTEDLVAVGMQNKDIDQRASIKSMQRFLDMVKDLHTAHPNLQGAYYASSYGYELDDPSSWAKKADIRKKKDSDAKPIEIKLFEYKDKIYFESKSTSYRVR